MSAGLNVARDGAVLTLTIDRPDRRNALDVATYAALSEQLTLAGGDQTLAAVILLVGAALTLSGALLHVDVKKLGQHPRWRRLALRRPTTRREEPRRHPRQAA